MMIVALLLAGAPIAGRINFRHEVSLVGDRVRLGDIADLEAVPASLRPLAAELTLAVLRHDRRRQTIAGDRLASRTRALMPALATLLPADPADVTILRHGALPALPLARNAAGRDIARGDAVTLRWQVGTLKIERSGKALQVGYPGNELFVAVDREVVTAHCCEEP